MSSARLVVACAATLSLAFAAPAAANHTTIAWEGQNWEISHNATAAIDGAGDLVLTRTGPGDATLHVNRVEPAPGGNSFINANGTPWVKVSYLDNNEQNGIDFFVDSEIPVTDPRIQAGSLFSCEIFLFTRYNIPAIEDPQASGCGGRAAGEPHTIYAGQRSDGTIDWNADGAWTTSTLLRDNTGPFPYNDVFLRVRAASGTTGTFTDFDAGAGHPSGKGDCKKGGYAEGGVFKNQGDCVSFFSTGK